MEKVRIGVIGYGNMGTGHIGYLSKNEVDNAVLTALCDNNPQKLEKAKKDLGDGIKYFDDYKKLLAGGEVDLIIIAVPHYFHPVIGKAALNAGIHVLSEKPIGVYTKDVEEMNDAAGKSGLTYSIMFQQRTDPRHKKIKEMLDGGVLGNLKRMVWIVTNWYRPQSYYNSGGWRATWAGEGGGVLINQCPHNLDLWQWFFGMPERIRGFCAFGKYRDIEVEDDVTAYMEYKNGATGTLMTTTGETPGTNRLEVSGDNGKLIFEGGKILLYKNEIPESEFNKTYTGGFGGPKHERIEIEVTEKGGGEHKKITQNTVNNILFKEPLIAEAYEGLKSLTISNSIYLSTWTDSWTNLPIDKDLYLEELKKRIASSKSKENIVDQTMDLSNSNNV
jgi:predicted dehydrogenase